MSGDTAGTELQSEYQRWMQEVTGKSAKRNFTTLSGISVDPLYISRDSENVRYTEKLGFPGEYPFTRGVQQTMYRGKLWTMRQYAGYGTAEESNQRYRYLLSQGQTGLSVAFDLPTQTGYDSDHEMALAEVGKVGVAISSLSDMEILLQQMPLDKISTSMTINSTAGLILAMYLAVAENKRIPFDSVEGTVQNDILKEYIARGTYIYPPEASMRLVTDIIEFCYKNVPKYNPISISGYHMREAGATAVQEIAFTLSNGIAYVRAAIARGLNVDFFAPRLSFFFGCHNDFFEEVAKFRAARRMWARIVRQKFGAKNPASCMLRFHTQTCGVTLAAQQPEVNLIRVTLQALAAVLGGTQSLHANSFDEALSLPSEGAALLALRTQQVLAHESNVASTIDPLGGSYYLESLTDELEQKAEQYIEEIERLGGGVVAAEKGFYQREIADSAYRYQQEVERKDRTVVGVNDFVVEQEIPFKTLKVNESVLQQQTTRLQKTKQERNASKVKKALDSLYDAAGKDDNLMPLIFKAVKEYATNGEISDVLRNVFGEHKPLTIV